jgi:hypothetical protein
VFGDDALCLRPQRFAGRVVVLSGTSHA